MVTVCQKCGDRGFVEALLYCDKCHNYALHRYCHEAPAEDIFDDDLTWLCVDCEPKIVKVLTTKSTKNRKRRLKRKRYRFTPTRVVAKKKVQKCEWTKMNLQLCKANPSEHEAEGSNKCENGRKLGNQCALVLKDQCNSSHDDIPQCVKTSQITTTDLLEITEPNSYVPAQPIIDPIWKGSLSIFNKDFNNVSGLVGHLSSLACPKVREEAELLPLLLIPELVHRTDVWPKAFEKYGPSDQSIALYFFPDSERDEKDFDTLVGSMIQDDLAMKAVLENAELLVFPSVILPELYRRFQSKLYLWGVFRTKQIPQLTNGSAPSEEKYLANTLTCYGQSPVSTLSNDVDNSCDNPEPVNSYCPSVM